jgi:phosphoribosylanthranilate isomerase
VRAPGAEARGGQGVRPERAGASGVVKVKICGIRRLEEALAALEAGADFLGFVFYPPSHRHLAPAEACALLQAIRAAAPRRDWAAVGVFVNEPVEWVNEIAAACGLDYVQLHGTEPPEYCARMTRPVIKAVRLTDFGPRHGVGAPGTPTAGRPSVTAATYGAERLLIDSQVPGYWGGSGQRFDWEAARPYAAEALVAGGLTPENVADALDVLRPWGLDVSSGVERDKVKDPALIRAFMASVRRWEERADGH